MCEADLEECFAGFRGVSDIKIIRNN
jgi:RNA recognition motif-containing protein